MSTKGVMCVCCVRRVRCEFDSRVLLYERIEYPSGVCVVFYSLYDIDTAPHALTSTMIHSLRTPYHLSLSLHR